MDNFSTLYDIAPLLSEGGEAFDPSRSRWYRVGEGYPKQVCVSADELGDLAGLIARIEEALDINFAVELFVWTEDQLATWTVAQEARVARSG